MLITRTSLLTGIERSMEIPVTQEELDNYVSSGQLIQNALPHLTPAQREFIMTGITEEEWEQHLGDPDSDEPIKLDFDSDGSF